MVFSSFLFSLWTSSGRGASDSPGKGQLPRSSCGVHGAPSQNQTGSVSREPHSPRDELPSGDQLAVGDQLPPEVQGGVKRGPHPHTKDSPRDTLVQFSICLRQNRPGLGHLSCPPWSPAEAGLASSRTFNTRSGHTGPRGSPRPRAAVCLCWLGTLRGDSDGRARSHPSTETKYALTCPHP